MRTVLRKLFGASIGGGAAQSFFVFALTALIAGAPLAARAQDSAVVGTVTFHDKTADATSAVTVGRPDLTNATIDQSNWTSFTVTPANLYGLPEGTEGELTLSAISVMWLNDNGNAGDIAQAQHIVLVDASGNVVAVSEAPDVTPAQEDITSTYAFPADTTLDATATYTGYFVADAASVAVGEAWSGTAVEVRTRIFVDATDTTHDDCFVGTRTDLLPPIGFAFGAGDLDALEWTATPWFTADAAAEAGAYGKFQVRFQWMWQGERFPWPNEFSLNAVTVPFRSGHNDTNNTSVRRLVLTDSANTVVALSAPLETPPASAEATVTFTFSGERLSPAETYTGYFVGTDYPALGQENYTASPLGSVRFQVRDQVANGGCAVGEGSGATGHAPDFTFAVSASEPAPEEEFVNGDAINVDFQNTNTNILAAETLYGLAGIQYPGSAWTVSTSANTTFQATDTAGVSVSVTTTGQQMNRWHDAGDALLRQGIQDSVNDTDGVSVAFSGVPYEQYDAYIYMGSNEWNLNGTVTVTTDAGSMEYYTMPAGATEATLTDNRAEGWGNATASEAALGQTVMRIANLSGMNVKFVTHRDGTVQTRGCINAIQIVERKRSGANEWEGTLAGAVNASAVEVQNTTTGARAKLTELGADDVVRLSFSETVSLTVDADVNADTLTLTGEGENAPLIVQTAQTDGGAIVAENVRLTQGTLMAGVGAFASENPITLATGTTLGVMGTGGAAFTQAVTGAGAVRIWSGSDVTLSAAFTHTGGTTVATDGGTETITTTLRYAGQPLGEGPVTVGAGGVFDLCGLACDQAIALNGGTLANTGIPNPVTPQVASVNFRSGQGTVADGATGGLLAMLGDYWTDTTGGSGTATPDFVDLANITTSGATPAPIEGLQVAWSAGIYQDGANNTSFLKGYLDDNNRRTDYFASKVTVTVPENVARCGYDLYLYSSSDAGNYGFAPVPVRANGVVTHYTYENGEVAVAAAPALTATAENVAHWGSLFEGRNTVAEGTNVMVLRGRTETQLEIGLPSYGDPNAGAERARGCIAAIQIATGTMVCDYSGTLTVEGTGTLNAAAGTTFSGTLAGAGTLTKVGDGALSVTGATATAGTTLAATAGGLTFGEGNDLSGLTLNLGVAASVEEVSAFTLGALSGNGAFNLGDVDSLTFAGAAAEADYTGALSAGGALSLVKQGTNTQRLDNLAGVDALAVTAEAGTLALGADVPALTDLETRGGNVTGDLMPSYVESAGQRRHGQRRRRRAPRRRDGDRRHREQLHPGGQRRDPLPHRRRLRQVVPRRFPGLRPHLSPGARLRPGRRRACPLHGARRPQGHHPCALSRGP